MLATIPQALQALRDGRMIIVVDDAHRENEGDLVIAAEKVTPEAVLLAPRERYQVFEAITQQAGPPRVELLWKPSPEEEDRLCQTWPTRNDTP